MDFLNDLMNQFGGSQLESIGGKIGADSHGAKKGIEGALPVLLSALGKNTKSNKGTNAFLGALDRDHDGGILDNLGDLFNNPDQFSGNGILKHVLGRKEQPVAQGLSSKTGLSLDSISKLLPILAPIIMGFLGKKKRQGALPTDRGGLSDLFRNLGNQSHNNTDLDLGDLLGKVTKGGGLLGKIFGR